MQSQGLCPLFSEYFLAPAQDYGFLHKILDFVLVCRLFFSKVLKSIAGMDYQQHYKIHANKQKQSKSIILNIPKVERYINPIPPLGCWEEIPSIDLCKSKMREPATKGLRHVLKRLLWISSQYLHIEHTPLNWWLRERRVNLACEGGVTSCNLPYGIAPTAWRKGRETTASLMRFHQPTLSEQPPAFPLSLSFSSVSIFKNVAEQEGDTL
jgi:hypothetical protein